MRRLLALAVGATVAAVAAWMAVRGGPAGGFSGLSAATDARRASAREFWDAYKTAGERRATGDCEAAIRQYARALALRPGHEDSLYYMGNCHAERGERALAFAAYQRLVDVNPEGSSRGYMQMGILLASAGPDGRRALDAAEQQFTRALEVDSDSGAMLALAEVALLRRRWDEAARRLDAASADNAMSIAAPYLQAYLRFRRRDRAAAWERFLVAVARVQVRKGPVAWSEEGDVKADPALRWRALARQSLFGEQWSQLGRYLEPPGPSMADMEREFRALGGLIEP